MKSINLIARTWIFALLSAALSTGAQAEQTQIYFTAMVAPEGSIVNTLGQDHAVYLRWDALSGTFPADVQGFHLLRNDAHLISMPRSPMSEEAIENLYADSVLQGRREAEMLSRLQRSEDYRCSQSLLLDLACEIRSRLTAEAPQPSPVINPDSALPANDLSIVWPRLAGRMDFNVAQANRRAYLDNTASGQVIYELIADLAPLGDSPGPEDKRLGLLEVNADMPTPLPAPEMLEQVYLGRCDAPEENKDHGAINLTWELAESGTDEFNNGILTAGFAIYRQAQCDTEPLGTAAFSNLLDTATLDPYGYPVLDGMLRVVEQPVSVSGGKVGDRESRYRVFNAPYAQFMQTADQVRASGLQPGDICHFYVISRDITGNYGGVARQEVVVPDLVPPPSPWRIQTLTDNVHGELDNEEKNHIDLSFDHINVANYLNAHSLNRTYCNLASAEEDKALIYVEGEDDCKTGVRRRVKTDVVAYNIYRFDNTAILRSFQDSDGDGVGDLEERGVSAFANTSAIGDACDANIKSGSNYRVDDGSQSATLVLNIDNSMLVTRPDGRKVVEFSDVLPASDPGGVYWYLVNAVHQDGTISEMSAPVRALFKPVVKPARGKYPCELGEETCRHKIVISDSQTIRNEPDIAWVEDKTGDARWVNLSCKNDDEQRRQLNYPMQVLQPGFYGAQMSVQACDTFVAQQCDGNDLQMAFLNSQGRELATQSLPACLMARYRLENDCGRNGENKIFQAYQSASPFATGPMRLKCELPPSHCVKVFRETAGQSYPLGTWCEDELPLCFDGFMVRQSGEIIVASCPEGPTRVPLPNTGGEITCLSSSIINDNNIASTDQQHGCFTPFGSAPQVPEPLGYVFSENLDDNQLSWLPPHSVLGTLVKYYRNEASAAPWQETVFHSHPEWRMGDGRVAMTGITLPAALDADSETWEEEWCLRVRSVGRSVPGGEQQALSPWSDPKCQMRLSPEQALPEYLAWPKISAPQIASDLHAVYLHADGVPAIHLNTLPDAADNCGTFAVCDRAQFTVDIKNFITSHKESAPQGCFPKLDDQYKFNCNACDAIESAVAPHANFVAYRQQRDEKGELSDFYQVSPFVPGIFCQSGTDGGAIIEDPLIKLIDINFLAAPWNTPSAIFLDRYPHIGGMKYRYEFVYFDHNHEVLSSRTSNWIGVPIHD